MGIWNNKIFSIMKPFITAKKTISEANLREEALQMLDKKGALLDVAR